MRISTEQQYRRLQQNMESAQVRMAEMQAQLSSGKKLNRASDDPFAAIGVIAFRSARALAVQYSQNASSAKLTMQMSEAALGDIGEIVKRAQSLTVSGANAATLQEGRDSMAAELTKLMDQMLSAANTKDQNGNYIFAGYQTDTKPFVPDAATEQLQYFGDNGERIVDVGPGTAVPANQIVSEQMVDAYAAVKDARDRLLAGDLSGLSGVSLQLLEEAGKSVRQVRGDAGVSIQTLDESSVTAQRRSDEFTGYISDREDADISEVAVNLQAAQASYQSALAAFATLNQASLLDFLRR